MMEELQQPRSTEDEASTNLKLAKAFDIATLSILCRRVLPLGLSLSFL